MKLNIVSWLWLLIFGLPGLTQAQFTFTTNNGSITITGYSGSGGAVVIPDTINELSVTAIGNQAFTNCGSLTSVTIPDSVTNIGSYVFTNCIGLTNIIVPASVLYIGSKAFAFCTNLLSVYFLGNAPTLGGGILLLDSTSALVYDTPGTTGWGTGFGGRPTVFWLPSDYYSWTTNDDDSLTITVYMSPNGAVSIPPMINDLPVTGIASGAFTNCASLTNIVIPASVTNIEAWAFYYCTNLTAITVDMHNPVYSSSADGVLFSQDLTTLFICPEGKTGTYNVPCSVTNIEYAAFELCGSLTTIIIPTNVANIGDWAFYFCGSLSSIALPNNLTTIGNDVFFECWSLTNFVIPACTTSIGDGAFCECSNLACVAIPDTVTNIGYTAFVDCVNMTNLTIGTNITVLQSSLASGLNW